MAGKKYLTFDTTTGKQKLETSSNSGGGDAGLSGAILALDTNGRIDASFLPATNGQFSKSVVATEALNSGDWVQVYYDSGAAALRVRKAFALDATKPANGFVLAATAQGDQAVVYFSGANDEIAIGTGVHAIAVTDISKPVFLASTTQGLCTLTAPSSSGNLIQRLGYVIERGSAVTVVFDLSHEILVG